MRRIEWTTAFKRDFKREKKGKYRKTVAALVDGAVASLAEDRPLAAAKSDHPLTGEWTDHRDCHLKPDLLLIYRKPDANTLTLARLGSHSELFG